MQSRHRLYSITKPPKKQKIPDRKTVKDEYKIRGATLISQI